MGVTFHCRSEGSSNFGIRDFLLNLLVILSFFSSSFYRSFLNRELFSRERSYILIKE